MPATGGGRVSRRWLRALRVLGIGACALALALTVPAVDTGAPSRGDSFAALLRLLFVPLGEVTDPVLLRWSRSLLAVGLVLIATGEFIRRRMNRKRRHLRRSGDPSVRSVGH